MQGWPFALLHKQDDSVRVCKSYRYSDCFLNEDCQYMANLVNQMIEDGILVLKVNGQDTTLPCRM